MTTGKSMKRWCINACPLFNKFSKLKFKLVTNKPDIVAVTEVNCKFSGSDVEFNIDDYKTIQNTTTDLHQCGVPYGGIVWQG